MARSRPSEPVRVINVVDGDTVDVVPANARRGGEATRVRLWGIDAPEWQQPLGPEATRALNELFRDGRGALRMEVFAYDQYARALGLLYWDRDGRGQSVNRAMVRLGYAYTSRYRQGQSFRKALGFDAAEAEARRRRDGVWGLAGGERELPWAYRSRQRQPERARGFGPVVRLVFLLLALGFIVSVVARTGILDRFVK